MTRIVFAVILWVCLVLLAGFLVLGPGLEQRVTPGVWLWELPVGGKPPEESLSGADESLALHEPRITVLGPNGQRWAFSPADLGLTLEPSATLGRVLAPGHNREGLAALVERWEVWRQGTVVAPVLVWEPARAEAQLRTLATQLDTVPRDAGVRLDDTTLSLEPGVSGLRVEVTATLAALEPLLRVPSPAEVRLVVTRLEPEIGDATAARALDVARTILAEPLHLLLPDPQEGDPGPWNLSSEVLAQMLVIRTTGAQLQVEVDDVALTQFLEPVARALAQEPVEASFHFDGSTQQLIPLTASQVGREMDVPATIALIGERLREGQHFVPLVVREIPPRYPDTATAEELGVRELIAVGESYFVGSSSARDHNIRLGASKFDGLLIAPGETFSFNKFLGEVTPDEGYEEAYVISGNRTVPGIGGGLCQVATTAFRAAFYAGYPILERWQHAYRVSYYELGGFGPGFDAAIYSPSVDLRFTNDRSYPLLIETEVDAAHARLRFLFYSTDDGRTVEQLGPTWGEPEPPGPPRYEYDPDLPSGTTKKLESAHDGLFAVLGRVVRDAEGKVLYEDHFTSHFAPWPARYAYGPGFVPPPEAEGDEP